MANLDFIAAKVHGMRGHLYEDDSLRRLCDAPSVEDLTEQLAPGEPVGDTIGLQRVLTTQHLASLYRLHPLLDGWMADLYLWLLRRYQVENLKVIVRGWAAKLDERAVSRYMIGVPDKLALPLTGLMKASSMEALLDVIPVASFREGALLGLGNYENTQQLFFIEAGLDKAYFGELKRIVGQAPGPLGTAAERLVNFELDVYNAMLTIRTVFNYELSFNAIRHLLAPFGRHVTGKVLDQIRAASGSEEAEEMIPAALLHPGAEGDAETAMWRRLYDIANHQFYASGMEFGAVIAFYYIKRVELSNLIKISEGIRYGQRADAIRNTLIGRSASETRATSPTQAGVA
jgi:V/A-type H+/Na+-transporting ATPase subunit C